MEDQDKAQTYEWSYIKLYKLTKNYNWEIKLFENTPKDVLNLLIKDIKKINETMLNIFERGDDEDED